MILEANHPNPVAINSAGVCQFNIANAIIEYNDWKHLNRNIITFEYDFKRSELLHICIALDNSVRNKQAAWIIYKIDIQTLP